ncbi:hypothetical protein CCHR01_13137 [Colletotrichum chrysophilum]|uniref:Uncharacterized protein n=1 Tax=Colletotrichum chrysophilum TaxID=1836956 RepID=A0AAD9AB50_9PEZI|nr:hypothetical protein CCHR01_13137 [Colletotrichum chrysophilum]
MPMTPQQTAHLNRQARRRAERAAEEMSFGKVSSEDYLMRLRSRRRPGRPYEVEDIPAAVEIEDDDDAPAVPSCDSKYSSNARWSFPQHREAPPRMGATAHVPRTLATVRARDVSSPSPIARSSTRFSAPSRGLYSERPKSQHDLLSISQHTSVTTLGSGTPSSASQSRSTLSLISPNKSVRRAAADAALSTKPDAFENDSSQRRGHSRSQSTQTVNFSDGPLPRGTLQKRSSLRVLKDKIRRVASAFELRSARDDEETSEKLDLKHNKSTRSLLRYSGTRIRRRRLDTVNEET